MRRSGFKRLSFQDAVGKRKGKKPISRFGLSQKPLKRGKQFETRPDRKLAAWGRQVKKRDGNCCQFPGGCITGDVRIDSHHIAKRSQRRDLKYEPSNGIALCRTHHNWTDGNHDEAVELGLLNIESYELARKRAT